MSVSSSTVSSCPVCGASSTREDVELGGYRLYLCPSCTVRFAPDAFEERVDYDRVYRSAEYEGDQVRALESFDGTQLAEHPTYRAFFDNVPHPAGARLLDVGCGVGRFCQAAYALGWDVTGTDVSALAIATGRKFARFPMRVETVEELIDQGDRFEVVTAFEVLEHLSAPVEFLSRVRQLLRPGGHAFCTVPNWHSALVRTTSRPDWIPPIHLLFFTGAALHRTAELSGLDSVTTGVIWSDPMPSRLGSRARWVARRILRRPREPLGLWVRARRAA
jgi:SAM-dependent methyltransferase